MSVEHQHIRLEQEYPHPADAVFAAWSDADLKRQWFDLSDDRQGAWHSECRVGGVEYYRSPAGSSPAFAYHAVHRDVVDAERIILTSEITVDGRRSSVALSTAEFVASRRGTVILLTEQVAFLDGLETVERRTRGIGTQLGNLAALLDRRS